MKLFSDSFADQHAIPGEFAFGASDGKGGMVRGGNRSPHLAWSDLPRGTRTLVLMCFDPDVPSRADDVNRPGHTVPGALARVDFFHWLMVDIDPALGAIEAGSCSDGVMPHGKHDPHGPAGARQGINDYTAFFAGDPDMRGEYRGYDGPCPPWNDEIVHHYHFALCATDLERCPVEGGFTGADVRTALEGHVLDETRIVGLYSLNPRVPAA